MPSSEEIQQANVNRSIRTIKAELEYLCDASVITPHALSDLLARLPAQTALHAPLSVGALPSAIPAINPTPQPPATPMDNLSLHNTQTNGTMNGNLNEKNGNYFNDAPVAQPPPAYNAPPGPLPPQANWPPLAQATALYAYSSADAGDLELQPNDHINITEYMNAEWWKGKSTRTGQEGIFPRSYVRVIEDKAPVNGAAAQSNNSGNMPLQVSGGGNGEGKAPSKAGQMGKKVGSRFGSAVVFGAGATVGSNIVNSIF